MLSTEVVIVLFDMTQENTKICLIYSEGKGLAPSRVFSVNYHSTVALRSFMFQRHYIILAVDLTIKTLKINEAVYWC